MDLSPFPPENGHLQYWHNYSDGYKHGVQRIYWKEGQIREQSTYEYDVKNGECKSWDENGRLVASGIYKDDVPWQGTFVFQPPMEAEGKYPALNDYIDRFLNRGFIVAEFSDGEYVRMRKGDKSN